LIAVVDYGMGNLRSVLNALDSIEAPARLAPAADDLASAEKIILPGVGAFGDGMRNLHERGLVDALRKRAADGCPVLGICLGMQLLADRSYEYGEHEGLGLIPGEVRLIDTDASLRIPHVGWNDLRVRSEGPLYEGLGEEPIFYFVHSYEFLPAEVDAVTATTDYGRDVTACVERGSVFGVQFHPEKSQRDGIQLLRNFVALQPC
jgi:imidazole glycerol-phosphate synthase subunit HisH